MKRTTKPTKKGQAGTGVREAVNRVVEWPLQTVPNKMQSGSERWHRRWLDYLDARVGKRLKIWHFLVLSFIPWPLYMLMVVTNYFGQATGYIWFIAAYFILLLARDYTMDTTQAQIRYHKKVLFCLASGAAGLVTWATIAILYRFPATVERLNPSPYPEAFFHYLHAALTLIQLGFLVYYIRASRKSPKGMAKKDLFQ